MPPVYVRSLMTAPVVALFAEQTLPLAASIMKFKHLRHLPVIDDAGRLVGLVSHRDILRAQVSSLTGPAELDRAFRPQHVHASQIMTRDVWTVTADTLASTAGTMMLEKAFGCVPVVDAAGVLVGIVTEHDYLRFAVKALALHD